MSRDSFCAARCITALCCTLLLREVVKRALNGMAVGRYTILTYQARVPVGEHNLPEIPAGMLDGSGHFKGVAAEEMEEECDIVISEEELIDLTELAYGSRWRGMIPSAGGCDEFIRLFLFRRQVEQQTLDDLEGRLTGLREEGERIKLHIIPLEEAWRATPDGKALSAMALYDRLGSAGKLPTQIVTPETAPGQCTTQSHVLTQQPVGH